MLKGSRHKDICEKVVKVVCSEKENTFVVVQHFSPLLMYKSSPDVSNYKSIEKPILTVLGRIQSINVVLVQYVKVKSLCAEAWAEAMQLNA